MGAIVYATLAAGIVKPVTFAIIPHLGSFCYTTIFAKKVICEGL
jgi:hypothetical protein